MNNQQTTHITGSSYPLPVDGPAEERQKLINVSKLWIILGSILGIVLIGLFIWGVIWLAGSKQAELAAVRDILIIALALESCFFGIIMLLMLVMIVRLVNMLEYEVKPILQKTDEAIGNIRGTTTFVSKNVVKPVNEARIQVAGFRRAMKTLFGNPRKNLPD